MKITTVAKIIVLTGIGFISGVWWERWSHSCYLTLGMYTVRVYRGAETIQMDYVPAGNRDIVEHVCGNQFYAESRAYLGPRK